MPNPFMLVEDKEEELFYTPSSPIKKALKKHFEKWGDVIKAPKAASIPGATGVENKDSNNE